MSNLNNLYIFILILLTTFPICSVSAKPIKTNTHVINSAINSTLAPSINIETFLDRRSIQYGESINLKVWINSKITDSVDIQVFYSEDRLLLNNKKYRTVKLPINQPERFTFRGLKYGKYDLYLRITGINKNNNIPFVEHKIVRDIEVKRSLAHQTISKLISGTLPGVIVGTILGLMVTLFNNSQQEKKENKQRKKWIVQTLPSQLKRHELAIRKAKPVRYQWYMNKLLKEGYYDDLLQLIAKKSLSGNLAEELLDLEWKFKEYEKEKNQSTLNDKFSNVQKELQKNIFDLINNLQKLK